jgi:hypothetical protein
MTVTVAPKSRKRRLEIGNSSDCDIGQLRLPEPALGLDEADDGVGNVRLLERGSLVGGQFHVHRCKSVVEMVQLGGADDRRGDYRLGQ